MKYSAKTLRSLCLGSVAGLAACGSPVNIRVSLVDPCNQAAVDTMDFLRIEPRGEGIDSLGLSTTAAREDGTTPEIQIPLVEDFQLVVTGHRGAFDAPASGIGVSSKTNLAAAAGEVDIQVPFALVNSFYKTTSLGDPEQCTDLRVGRYGATATYIPDNGKVLIVGGAALVPVTPDVTQLEYTRIVEMYDPATGTFEQVDELRVGQNRMFHSATYLGDGQVLIAGGEARVDSETVALRSAFIIDAQDPDDVRSRSETLVLREARTGHTATRLPDGRVLVVGGRDLVGNRPQDQLYSGTLELFDPQQGAFVYVNDAMGNSLSIDARYGHSTMLMPAQDGAPPQLMVAGGMNEQGPVLGVQLVTLQGGTGSAADAADQIGVGPIFHAASMTETGQVLLSGGYGRVEDAEPSGALPDNPSASVEMWTLDGGTLRRTCTGNLVEGRGFHTSTTVGRRAVFVGGRGPTGQPLATAEVALLALGASCFAQPPQTQMMSDPRTRHAVTRIESSGELLIIGGRRQESATDFGQSLSTAEIFSPAREP